MDTIRYNHNHSYVTHISVQCHNAECVDTAKSNYVAKPIVMDEVRYEGNISTRWGSMSADEMTQRFWMFFAKGAYCGHSETVLPGNWSTAGSPCHEPRCDHPHGTGPEWDHDEDPCPGWAGACGCSPNMWWNHGGALHGDSPPRIAYFRSYAETATARNFRDLVSSTIAAGVYMLHNQKSGYRLVFFDNMVLRAPVAITLTLTGNHTATRIDYMQMTREPALPHIVPAGVFKFTPPTADYILELKHCAEIV